MTDKWEELKVKEEIPQLKPEEQRIINLIYDVFELYPKGKELLKIMLDKYLHAPVCPPNQNAAYGYYREGQNSIFLHFLKTIQIMGELPQRK